MPAPVGTLRLERRAERLAAALHRRVITLSQSFGPRPPFTEQFPKREALAWWRVHRFDELGQRVLQHFTPLQVLELDLDLARQQEAEQAVMNPEFSIPLPEVSDATL